MIEVSQYMKKNEEEDKYLLNIAQGTVSHRIFIHWKSGQRVSKKLGIVYDYDVKGMM